MNLLRMILNGFFSGAGRMRRRDFWLFMLTSRAVMIGVMLATGVVEMDDPIYGLVWVFGVWTGLVLALKRAHDRGKGGGWVVLFSCVPVVGWLWGLVELGFLPGQAGPNRFGPPPRGGRALAASEAFA